MPAATTKRPHPPSRAQAPLKKRRRQREYHSGSEEEEADNIGQDFPAVSLLESDSDDVRNAVADEAVSDCSSSNCSSSNNSSSNNSSRGSQGKDALSSADEMAVARKLSHTKSGQVKKTRKKPDEDEQEEVDGDVGDGDEWEDEDDHEDSEDNEGGSGSDSDGQSAAPGRPPAPGSKQRTKRKDPSAFATSMSKILSAKLSTARRPDPVLTRSADAQAASREVVESALEAKVRRQMRDQKRAAQEKGRVRDVLLGKPSTGRLEDLKKPGGGRRSKINDRTTAAAVADEEGRGEDGGRGDRTVAEVQEEERRLRKVAQRGVVKLFNAVRAAQITAVEAEAGAKRDGVLGSGKREGKVQEMSRKGFLDLIASGGGGLKKGALEEA